MYFSDHIVCTSASPTDPFDELGKDKPICTCVNICYNGGGFYYLFSLWFMSQQFPWQCLCTHAVIGKGMLERNWVLHYIILHILVIRLAILNILLVISIIFIPFLQWLHTSFFNILLHQCQLLIKFGTLPIPRPNDILMTRVSSSQPFLWTDNAIIFYCVNKIWKWWLIMAKK